MLLLVQVTRSILNLLIVGLWLERALVYLLGRKEACALVSRSLSRGYVLGARMGENNKLEWRPLCFLGYGVLIYVILQP